MSDPTIQQVRRTVTLPDGAVRYEVTTQVTDAGDLPHPFLFVVTIVDPLDPKSDVLARVATPHELQQVGDAVFVKVDSTDLRVISGDTFARIASPNDLTQLPTNRAAAVNLGLSTYLTSTVTLLFDNATTAQAAFRTIVDRLSMLVVEYRQFRATFLTFAPPFYQQYVLPQISASAEAALIEVYRQRRADRLAAEAARDAAQAAFDDCEGAGAVALARLDDAVADVAFLERARTLVSAMVETATITPPPTSYIPNNVVKTFVLNAGDPQSYESLLLAKRARRTQLETEVASSRTTCSALQQTLLDAQIVVNSARRAEEAALATVLAVCPTFSPSS